MTFIMPDYGQSDVCWPEQPVSAILGSDYGNLQFLRRGEELSRQKKRGERYIFGTPTNPRALVAFHKGLGDVIWIRIALPAETSGDWRGAQLSLAEFQGRLSQEPQRNMALMNYILYEYMTSRYNPKTGRMSFDLISGWMGIQI